jgi:hypothetical protein
VACAVAAGAVITSFIFLGPGEAGAKAAWFSGAGAFSAVGVAMWQTLKIQRRAKQDADEAFMQLRNQLAAAEQRSARELALTQTLHRAEMKAQRELARAELAAQRERAGAELAAQRERARAERLHHLALQQKQAMIEVSRAVSAPAQMLATLWNQAASILRIEDPDEREQAIRPIFEQIGQVVSDFSVEFTNARLLVDDDRLDEALVRVNAAVELAIQVAEEVHDAVVEGRAPHPNPILPVQQLMHARAAEARHLAWGLLRTGLNDGAAAAE